MRQYPERGFETFKDSNTLYAKGKNRLERTELMMWKGEEIAAAMSLNRRGGDLLQEESGLSGQQGQLTCAAQHMQRWEAYRSSHFYDFFFLSETAVKVISQVSIQEGVSSLKTEKTVDGKNGKIDKGSKVKFPGSI